MDTAIETQQIRKDTSTTLAEATQLKVVDNGTFERAGAMLKAIMGLRKQIGDTFDPHIKRAHEAHKALVAEKNTHAAPLIEAESLLKRGLLGYQQEQERKRREEEARLAEIARKEQERLEARAVKADDKGKTEKADELRAQAATVAAPIVERTVPKLAGISTRKTYSYRVTDLKALCAGIAAGTVPANAVIDNGPVLNKLATALKDEFKYPGVELVTNESIASRST